MDAYTFITHQLSLFLFHRSVSRKKSVSIGRYLLYCLSWIWIIIQIACLNIQSLFCKMNGFIIRLYIQGSSIWTTLFNRHHSHLYQKLSHIHFDYRGTIWKSTMQKSTNKNQKAKTYQKWQKYIHEHCIASRLSVNRNHLLQSKYMWTNIYTCYTYSRQGKFTSRD